MNNNKNRLIFLIFTSIMLFRWGEGVSQSEPYPNCSEHTTRADLWNWEADYGTEEYYKKWYAYMSNHNQLINLDAPWVNPPVNSILRNIQLNNDYTKEKGWVLLKRYFGNKCKNSQVTFPYFILYNKYNGLVRIFVHINPTIQGINGITILLSHKDEDQPSALISRSSLFSYSSDYYNLETYNNDSPRPNEEMLLNLAVSRSNGWTVGEFNAWYDPFIRQKASSISVEISGFIQSEISLEGTTKFILLNEANQETVKQYFNNNTFSLRGKFSGNKSNSGNNSIYEIGSTFTSIYKTLEGVGFDKFAQGLQSQAEKMEENHIFSKDDENSKNIKEKWGKIHNGTKSFSGFINLLQLFPSITNTLGTFLTDFLGTIDPNSEQEQFKASISEGFIQLNGKITTSVTHESFYFSVPGAQNGGNSEIQLPFTDCPLGLFNLIETPILKTVEYEKTVGQLHYYGTFQNVLKQDFVSYKLANQLNIEANPTSEVIVESVQASIFVNISDPTRANRNLKGTDNVPFPDDNLFYPAFFHEEQNDEFNPVVTWIYYDFLSEEIRQGNYKISQFTKEIKEDGSFGTNDYIKSFETQVVDLSCANQLSVNIPKDNIEDVGIKLYIRYRFKNSPHVQYAFPVFYAKKEQGNPDNFGYDQESLHVLYPYDNRDIPLATLLEYENTILLGESDPLNIEPAIDKKSSHSIVAKNVLVTHSTGKTIFSANNEIILEPGFEVQFGSEFEGCVDLGGIQYSPCNSKYEVSYSSGGICSLENPNASSQRIAASLLEQKNEVKNLIVYPNPSSGRFDIEVPQGDDFSFHVNVFDILGNKVFTSSNNQGQTYVLDIHDKPKGYYILKVTNSQGKVYSKKLLID